MYGVGWFLARCSILHQLFLPKMVLSTMGKVDYVANQVRKAELRDTDYGVWHKV
jgi:hypothetical protein